MLQKLESLDSDFKEQHYRLVYITDDDETLQKVQQILDDHNDELAILAITDTGSDFCILSHSEFNSSQNIVGKLTNF